MDFLELAKNRYSCREFSNKIVEQEKINYILEAAKYAPTAVNFQPQRILVLTDKEKINLLNEATRFTFDANLMFVICYDKNVSWKRKYDGNDEGVIDASVVTTHMMLEITNLGLGSTWVGAFNPEKVREILNIPSNYEIVALLPTGYPSDNAEPSPKHFERLDLKETVFYNSFN